MQSAQESFNAPGLDDPSRLAHALCARALAWARTVCAALARSSTELEEDLLAEILAYELGLLRLRLAATSPGELHRYLAAVRAECARLREDRANRRGFQRKRPALPPSPASSAPDQRLPARDYSDSRDMAGRLTPEMVEQFRQLTGLDARTLVGKGENLASLVFYLSIHGAVSAHAPLRIEEAAKLLRVVRECRNHLGSVHSETKIKPHATLLPSPPAGPLLPG
jgi:hypothetical protein